MSDWRNEELKWRALTPFGVEIDHDFRVPLTPPENDRFVALFREFGLIVARARRLSMEQHTALLARLGPVFRRPGETGVMTNEHAHSSARAEYKFHADAAYTSQPFDALSLHALDVVDGASATRFASAERGYATLPEVLRGILASHMIDMISPTVDTVALRACDMRDPAALRRGTHPAVFRNPRTGAMCARVSEMHAACIVGLDWSESRAMLCAVYDHLYAPENTTEHLWHNGDLVIWDNVTFQHARRSLESAGRRVLQRIVVGTEIPEHAVGPTPGA